MRVEFEKEHNVSKLSLVSALLAINLVCTTIIGIVLLTNRTHGQHTLLKISEATAYVCRTTNVVDFIVVNAIKQTEANLKNGEYAHLVKIGVLTEKDLSQVKSDLAIYKSQHKVLTHNTNCISIDNT